MQAAKIAKMSSRLDLINRQISKLIGRNTHVPHIVIGTAVSWVCVSSWYGMAFLGTWNSQEKSNLSM